MLDPVLSPALAAAFPSEATEGPQWRFAAGVLRPPNPYAKGQPEACETDWRGSTSAVLALDLGTRLGWALADADGAIRAGSRRLDARDGEPVGQRYVRLGRFLTVLAEEAQGLAAVYYEAVCAHKGTLAAHRYGAFEGTLQAWCALADLSPTPVPVGTIKRSATGSGRASKEAVLAAMRARGFAPADDNEADALALLLWALGRGDAR